MASENFKNYILERGKEISIRISYDDVIIEKAGIKSVSKVRKADLLRSIMQYIDIVLDGNIDIKGKELSIDFGVSYEDSEYEYIHFGTFLVQNDTVKYSVASDETSFTCNDFMIKAHQKFDLSLVYPITIKSLVIAICDKLGYTLSTNSFINEGQQITQNMMNEALKNEFLTYRDVLDYIAQITGAIIQLNDNELQFVYTHETDYVFNGSNLKSMDVSDRIGPFNRLSFSKTVEKSITDDEGNEEITEDNVVYKREDIGSIEANGLTEISLSDNPFATDECLDSLFDYLKALEYYTYDIDSFGFATLDTLDMIKIIDFQGEEYSSIILNDTISINTGISEQFYVERSSSAESDYSSLSYEDKQIQILSTAYKELRLETLRVRNVLADTVKTKEFEALKGTIDDLGVGNLEAIYAKIDFTNVGTENVNKLIGKSSIFESVTGEEGILYELKSVKFDGDLIKANTIMADSLIITGEDGLYYRLNAEGGHLTEEQLTNEIYQKYLDGTNIVANSVTADKINVNKLSALTSELGDITGGSLNINDHFIVTPEGHMKTVDGEFSGKINAESGTIAGWIISNDEISTIRVMRKTYRLDKEDEETSIYLEYHDDVLVSAKDNDGNSLMSNGELTVDLSNYAIFTEDEEISKITKNGFYSYNDRYDYEYYPPNDDSGMVNVNAGKLKGHNDYISELTIDKGVITLVGHDGYKYANQIGGSAPDYNLTIHSKKIISDCTYQTSGREVQNTIDFSDEKMTLKSSKKNFYSGEVIGESYISISEEVLLESSVGGRILINPQGNEQYVGCMYIDTPDYVRIGGGGDVTANKLYLYEDKANFNGTDFRVNNNRLPYKTTSVTVKIGAHSANGIDSKTVIVSNAVEIAGWNSNGTGSSGLVLNRISCSGSSLYLEFRCILATDSTTEVVVYYRNY